jgi:RNA polymerase sigma-70 factor (ECF subfamily)
MKSSEELMILIQSGDSMAYEELYARFRGQVYGFLAQKVKGEDRDELFQVVFMKLHEKSHLYQREYPFKPWFFTLIRNSVIDFYRSQKITYVGLDEGEDPSYEPFENSESESGIEKLNGLSLEEEKLLYLKFVEGLGYNELQSEFKVAAASLRKRVSRLIKKLRDREGL